ncbi:thymidylate synthase [Candidatus Peregrinibacteria bacterium CG_4_9_14_0_2_um_filter_53_11]|nr:MAG: thymidylate synthase [Candidatus Peregrinibacteria bacterium CG_4_9_14_0_2_um_filter_53_11]
MQPYLSLLKEVLDNGDEKRDRTGVGTISLFGMQRKYNLQLGFPAVTTKKLLFDAVLHELLWFLRGSTNINDGLKEHTPIWNAWADPDGDLGPIYGYQWRAWEKFSWHGEEKGWERTHIDQISNAIQMIKTTPDSRRIIVSAWNVADIERMKLPPCHLLFQFYVVNGRLDCQLYQRSADLALGVPFNIASYALLMSMIAQECNLTPGIFTHTIGDAHIYLNHIEGIKEQLLRQTHPLPTLKIAKKPFWELKFEDFALENYVHEPHIKFPIAV